MNLIRRIEALEHVLKPQHEMGDMLIVQEKETALEAFKRQGWLDGEIPPVTIKFTEHDSALAYYNISPKEIV
jgi:hypothetical protein